METYLQIGVISSTHGVRGEVKVYPTTEPERFLDLDRVFLDTGKEKKEYHVAGVRFFKQFAIVKFQGIDNINDIEKYKGCSLYVDREDAIELEEDEYYIADLQGLDIYTENGELFGVLRDVMETGANDVYIVDSREHGEVLIPAIHDCILDVDLEKNRMTVHLLPGLVE
ncbi:MAG: ribosome maturation factor RimM [Fusicatenibacter sp.]|nr:ribosome maturation factor RimM [Fusicatenibacter sp.]